jgi:hypothetical protein
VAEQGVAGFGEGVVGGGFGATGHMGGESDREATGEEGQDQQHDRHFDEGETGLARMAVQDQGMHRATSVATGLSRSARGRAMVLGRAASWPVVRAARVAGSR